MHQEHIQELESTEQDIRQAIAHIDQERAAIQEIRENGGNPQTAETLLHALELALNVMEQHRELIRGELALGALRSRIGRSH
jgi:exosome complex RNA-binding protein Rrp42 (RNase PH superfamily)